MWKETIICIVIIIAIILGNYIIQKYTSESVEIITSELEDLREDLNKNSSDIQNNQSKEKIDKIFKNWEERRNKLAYFIEHDELEKVETDLTSIKSFIETNEYQNSISEVDKCRFVLNHIKDKYEFNLQNIF